MHPLHFGKIAFWFEFFALATLTIFPTSLIEGTVLTVESIKSCQGIARAPNVTTRLGHGNGKFTSFPVLVNNGTRIYPMILLAFEGPPADL